MYQLIDTHTHAISPDVERYPLAPVGGHQSDWSAKRPVSYERCWRQWTRPESPAP